MPIASIDPTCGRLVRAYPEATAEQAERAIERAHAAHRAWRQVSFAERAAALRRVAARLNAGSEEYARLMALEMGKPVCEGRAEVAKCALACAWFADHAEEYLAPEQIPTEATRSLVVFEPIGVLLAVMPWNFPFWQVFRCAAPALMAGNAVVLKHASSVPGCALAIAEAFAAAALPEGLFQAPLAPASLVAGMVAHPLVRAVALTGSTPAGREVGAHAGRSLKKTVLELGGSDPYVILADADVEHAALVCASSRLTNAGQSCIAAKRFIAVPEVLDSFTDQLVEHMSRAVMGDPRDEATTLGPLARADLRDELHDQVVRTVQLGARVRLGGQVPPGPGAFYPPTVLTDVRHGMAAYGEELFGPVASVIAARDEVDAVRIANDTAFGLGAAVFTRDLERGERIARRDLEAGCCSVNAAVRSDPRLPFGGVKDSGYGRELSRLGIREFVNAKTVYVA